MNFRTTTRIIFLLVISITATNAFGQTKIKLEDVNNHINDSVEVRGKVVNVTYLSKNKNKPTVIKVGDQTRKEILSIVVSNSVRSGLRYNLNDKKFLNGLIIVKGKLTLVDGKPQIAIKDGKQLLFIIDEEVPASEVPPIQKSKN